MVLSALVVSDPPHREVDLHEAAALLGLTPAEMRMKANFKAPEVWMAFGDMNEAASAVESLVETGLNVAAVDGSSLPGVPGPAPVSSFAFAGAAFVPRFGDDELEFGYDAPTLGVFCKPPSGMGPTGTDASPRHPWGRPSTLELVEHIARAARERGQWWAAETLELMANLDLYISVDGEAFRTSIAEDHADFSGLGDLMRPSAMANMAVCLSECERLFRRFKLDRRLENVRPRRRADVGSAERWERERKLYSFGTKSLRQLLAAIAPELRDITQYDLGSRLAYLMHRQAHGHSA